MGRHRDRRVTVEECWQLDVGIFGKDLKLLDNDRYFENCITWRDSLGSVKAVLGYAVGRRKTGELLMLIDPDLTSIYSDSVRLKALYDIGIDTTEQHIGQRHWFRCPIVREGKACNQRVRKLYLPPGQRVFGCRRCYDLSYRSCREHDKRKDALALDPEALDALWNAAIQSRDLREKARLLRLGIGGMAATMKRMQKHSF